MKSHAACGSLLKIQFIHRPVGINQTQYWCVQCCKQAASLFSKICNRQKWCKRYILEQAQKSFPKSMAWHTQGFIIMLEPRQQDFILNQSLLSSKRSDFFKLHELIWSFIKSNLFIYNFIIKTLLKEIPCYSVSRKKQIFIQKFVCMKPISMSANTWRWMKVH